MVIVEDLYMRYVEEFGYQRVGDGEHFRLKKDFQVLINVSTRYMKKQFDYLQWIDCLLLYGRLDEKKARALYLKLADFEGTNSGRFLLFIKEILNHISFNDIVTLLYAQDQADFANELHKERYGFTPYQIRRAEVPHAKFVQKFYCSMKQHVDNGVFENVKLFLKDMADTLKTNVNTYAGDIDRRQFNAEKLVAVYVLMLPQYTNFYERSNILNEMWTFFHEPKTEHIDSSSADIVYASKMAITSAIAGDFESAEKSALKARFLGTNCSNSLASTLAYHDSQFVHLQEYLKTGRARCLGNVLDVGDAGLRTLVDENECVRHQWTRIMKLYNVLTLLDITADFRMMTNLPSAKNVDEAKSILLQLRYCFEDIASRREMIYTICMARAHESSDLDLSITYMKKAINLSKHCHPFMRDERPNMLRYMKRLKRKLMIQTVLSWLIDISIPHSLQDIIFLVFLIVAFCVCLVYYFDFALFCYQ